MSKKRNYFKWKLRAGTRGTIRRTSRRTGNGFEVMGACVAMLDHARAESHWKDNPEGVFKTTIEDLATDYATPEARVREVLGALVATGWLQISGDVAMADVDEDIHMRVERYLTYNDPQGSDADRKAAERDRKMVIDKALAFRFLLASDIDHSDLAELMLVQGNVTGRPELTGVSPEEKRGEGEKEGKETPLSEKAAPSSNRPAITDEVTNVFDYWVKVEAQTGGLGSAGRGRPPKLTKDRAAKIRARLAEGYEPADLKMAIAFYAKDPHHSGDNDRQTRFTDLTTTLKNGSKVEAGVAGYSARRPQVAAAIETGELVRIERAIRRDLTGDEEAALQAGTVTVDEFLAGVGAA